MATQIYSGTNEHDGKLIHDSEAKLESNKRELEIPHAVGFCKNCFRSRRDGSAYCGQCQDEPKRFTIYTDEVHAFPLLFKVKKKFDLTFKQLENIIFTYGDTIYHSKDMPAHLVAHEITHVFQQQKFGVKEWWKKYLEDPEFRLEQELEAYRQQYKVAKARNEVESAFVLEKISEDLSSEIYGNIITTGEAKTRIMA